MGFFTALADFFRPAEPDEFVAPAPVGLVTIRRRLREPLLVPSRAQVFHFRVYAEFVWSALDMTEDELADWARFFTPHVRRDLTRTAATFAADYEPHHAHALEQVLNQALT